MKFPFTKKTIYDILQETKYIESDYLWEQKKHKKVPVYLGSEQKDIGLIFEIRDGKSIGVSLNLQGQRIRGINYRIRHEDSKGTVIRGWHEHIEEEGVLRAINLNFSDIDKLTEFALEKWNIKKFGRMGKQIIQGFLKL